MKTNLLIFIICLSLSTFSQDKKTKALNIQSHIQRIGIRAGVNLTNVLSDNYFRDKQFKMGQNIGFTYDYFLNNKYFINTEFIYVEKGIENDIDFNLINNQPISAGSSSIFKYNYLSLPLKIGYTIARKLEPNFSSFIIVGIVPSLLVKSEAIINENGKESSFNTTDRVNAFDLAALLELGANYNLGQKYQVFMAVSIHQSLTSFTNEDYLPGVKALHFGILSTVGFKCIL